MYMYIVTQYVFKHTIITHYVGFILVYWYPMHSMYCKINTPIITQYMYIGFILVTEYAENKDFLVIVNPLYLV